MSYSCCDEGNFDQMFRHADGCMPVKVLVAVGNRTLLADGNCTCGLAEFQGMDPVSAETMLVEDLAYAGYFQEFGPEDPTTGF